MSKPQAKVKERAAKLGAPKTFEDLQEIAESLGVTIPIQSPFTPNDVNNLLPLLRLPLDESALQESKASETRRGYDTIGYSYQAHVDRMNWILGPAHWTWRILNEDSDDRGTTSSGKVKYVYSGEIEILIGYREQNPETKQWEWVTVHSVPPIPTDHESLERGSARKGMLTKGIKRATSILGVGADAYLGVLDDDLVTGAGPGDDMATPRDKDWHNQPITEKEFNFLYELAKKKGLTMERLREWYKTKSEGKITAETANLTKRQAMEVKAWLTQLPDKKPEPPKEEKGEQEQPSEPKRPASLEELMSADEQTIRNIAAEFSFSMPPQLTDTNKKAICKTLGTLMKIS